MDAGLAHPKEMADLPTLPRDEFKNRKLNVDSGNNETKSSPLSYPLSSFKYSYLSSSVFTKPVLLTLDVHTAVTPQQSKLLQIHTESVPLTRNLYSGNLHASSTQSGRFLCSLGPQTERTAYRPAGRMIPNNFIPISNPRRDLFPKYYSYTFYKLVKL